ncbi:MAG: sigma-70 family RNA polymerase sigma factor [Cyanobacteriota bacterium]|nr:sigma-70 family RNA polymerase sigma factor [Cyanobacteriota bacterium]
MDFALTERSNSGLVDRFWQQWTEHEDMLYWCCLRLMNSNRTDAEDALSRAMLKAWEKVQKFEGKITNFKAWSIKLTRNLCIDIIRERSRGATGVESIEWVGDTQDMGMASSVESPERILEKEERSIEIRRAIADLPETLRDTFILHFYEELSHTEIAERQGISYNNVCRRIYVAKKKLKEKLSNYFLGNGENVSVTAGYGRKLSTQRKYEEKQEKIESEERKGWETGTKQLECDRAIFDGHSIYPIYPSPHHPITPSPYLPISPSQEVEKSEFVDSCVEQGDNVAGLTQINLKNAKCRGEWHSPSLDLVPVRKSCVGQTIQEVATVSVEVESDRVVEVEEQECIESAVESREQVNRKIQGIDTILTEQDLRQTSISSRGEWHSPSTDSVLPKNLPKSCEVECVEVVEAEKDGCVESSVGSNQVRRITISKSLRRSRSGRKQSQGFRRLLHKVAMTNVQLDLVSKDNRNFEKINNFIQPFYRTASIGEQKSLFLYHPRSEKNASLLSVACCLSTANKSHLKKSVACCLSRERSRWLRPYVMWWSLTGGNTKSELSSRLMGEMKFFFDVRGSLKDIQWSWDRAFADIGE